jgi:hypothetical protein
MKLLNKFKELRKKTIELSDFDINKEFNTRDGYIVANIKVYDYLNDKDLDKLIEKHNLTKYKDVIKKKFDEDIYAKIDDSVRTREIEYLREKYEDLVDITRKDNPEEHAKRTCVTIDCYILGRSGGWFSICKTDELEYITDIYSDYNLIDYDATEKGLKLLKDDFDPIEDYFKEIEDYIHDWEFKVTSVKSIVKDIEDSKKHFKQMLIDELEERLLEYINGLKYCEVCKGIELYADSLKNVNTGKVITVDDKKLFCNNCNKYVNTIKYNELSKEVKAIINEAKKVAKAQKEGTLIIKGIKGNDYKVPEIWSRKT